MTELDLKIEKLRPVAGDVLMVSLPLDMVSEDVLALAEWLAAVDRSLPDVQVLCKPADVELSMLSEDAMRNAGWVRASEDIPDTSDISQTCPKCGDVPPSMGGCVTGDCPGWPTT